MIKRILIGILIVIVVVVVGAGGYLIYHQFFAQKADTSQQAEVEIPVKQGLGEIPEAPGVEPEFGGLPDAEPVGDREIEAPEGELLPEGEVASEEGAFPEGEGDLQPSDLAGDVTGSAITGDATKIEPTLPDEQGTQLAAETTDTGLETMESSQPSGLAAEEQPTATPSETATTTPETTTASPTPTPGPAPGNYSVRTLTPVYEAQLGAVRKAMNGLGVRLKEQKTGQQHIQAYRLALGYFRTKAEAESWAQYNFKPRGVAYYVYPAQNMYSIQVGVYSHPQNVEVAMRQLYQKFPGWRLPIRREVTTITKAAYNLSISRISKSLADKIWRELNRLGIQTEMSGV